MRKLYLLAFLITAGGSLKAQQDTNYYRKYSERFIVSIYQSFRNYDVAFARPVKYVIDTLGLTKFEYKADADHATGMEIDFDKLSFSFTYKTTPSNDITKKGNTFYSNFGFSFGDNEMIVETNYRRYRGFYDLNTARYDTNFKHTGVYYQNPNMKIEGVKTKMLYFFNHDRFSYKSAYTCTYRQLKSAASLVVSGALFYNRMSTDTSFIPYAVRPYYNDLAYFHGLYTTGASMYWGAAFNLVIFKRFFANLTGVFGVDAQWRNYRYADSKGSNRGYIGGGADIRGATGYNGKNFFLTLSSVNDVSVFNSGQMEIKSIFTSVFFTYGYRFKVRERQWMKNVKETQLYKML